MGTLLDVDLRVEQSPVWMMVLAVVHTLFFLLLFKMSEIAICCDSEVRLYGRTPSVLR